MVLSESMADQLNNHLQNDGVIIINTYNRSFQYNKKHAGWFTSDNDGNLYVKSGKKKNCLTSDHGKCLMVDIKLYTYKKDE